MATVSPAVADENLAELLERLGDIPPERIRLRPPLGTATEADVLAAEGARFKRLCELIDGVLVEKTMGYRESRLAMVLGRFLDQFACARNLGMVTGADGFIKLWPGRVYIPDVAFASWDHLPGRRMPDKPIPELAPDLVVEVLSKSNTAREMERKRIAYFQVGVQLVWEVDPATREIHVYTAPDTVTTLTEADTLTGDPALPGFRLPVRDLFAELDRHG